MQCGITCALCSVCARGAHLGSRLKAQGALTPPSLAKLLVARATVSKFAHSLAPSPVTAGFERVAHEGFDMLLANSIFPLDISKTDMIG